MLPTNFSGGGIEKSHGCREQCQMKPVLIADDCETDVQAAVCLFQRSHIINPLVTLPNGEQTMAYLAGTGMYRDREKYPYPLLLLLDLKMRGVSGWDVLRWMKDTKQTAKVVVFTGLDIQHIKDVYAMGAQSFLFKPVSQEDFVNVLNHTPGITLRLGVDGVFLEPTR